MSSLSPPSERAATRTRVVRHALTKVPEVTVYFWIIKILTTGMGEAASDFLTMSLGPVIAVAVGLSGFLVSLRLQLRARHYTAWIYWSAIAAISVFGTMVADGIHLAGVPYIASTASFIVVLAAVFVLWRRSEGTLSIHSIHTLRREQFYWATVLSTFALGTAAGDFTASASGLHLGYLVAGLVFAGLFMVPGIAYRWLGLAAIPAFWASYVLTRPLGASFADWMAVSHKHGGLAWGTGRVTLVFCVAIVGFVSYLAITRKDVDDDAGAGELSS